MNIGVVSWWFNRGQATVGRHLRDALRALGHSTFILARRAPASVCNLPSGVDHDDVWRQEDVTTASSSEVPASEYRTWAKGHRLDVVFFDQNYQFEEIRALRLLGVKTIGRFVWESFCPAHAGPASDAFDVIYSLTRCEQARYASLGIDSPFVSWGCHPELVATPARRRSDVIEFFYPGGYLTARKPTQEVLRAFSQTPGESIRLVVKAQTLDRRRLRRHLLTAFPGTPAAGGRGLPKLVNILCDHVTRCLTKAILGVRAPDRRIRVIAADLPTVEYHRLFASCHVCLAPSRWEGLGLHLFESMAFGMPVISNDAPPMNEVVRNGHNGLLVRSRPIGQTRSGVPAMAADVSALSRAIERLSNDAEVSRMSENALAARERMSWDSTCEQLAHLLEA